MVRQSVSGGIGAEQTESSVYSRDAKTLEGLWRATGKTFATEQSNPKPRKFETKGGPERILARLWEDRQDVTYQSQEGGAL